MPLYLFVLYLHVNKSVISPRTPILAMTALHACLHVCILWDISSLHSCVGGHELHNEGAELV